MDLAEPTRTENIGGKRYFMVMIDDFSKYTWVSFFRKKFEAFDEFKNLCIKL